MKPRDAYEELRAMLEQCENCGGSGCVRIRYDGDMCGPYRCSTCDGRGAVISFPRARKLIKVIGEGLS